MVLFCAILYLYIIFCSSGDGGVWYVQTARTTTTTTTVAAAERRRWTSWTWLNWVVHTACRHTSCTCATPVTVTSSRTCPRASAFTASRRCCAAASSDRSTATSSTVFTRRRLLMTRTTAVLRQALTTLNDNVLGGLRVIAVPAWQLGVGASDTSRLRRPCAL